MTTIRDSGEIGKPRIDSANCQRSLVKLGPGGAVNNQSGYRVLVVEDERHIARFLEYVLLKEGIAVEVAFDGAVAEQKVATTPYSAVLLDLGLPRRTGLEVIRFIRSVDRHPTPLIIVLTAKSSGDVLSQVLAAGADAYCPKPVAPSTLLRKLAEFGMVTGVSHNGLKEACQTNG
jgi:CheY-like chemotaxis protein